MLYVWCVGLAKDVAYPLKSLLFSSNKVTSRKSKKLWTKGPEWNNAVTISHPAHGNTISTKEKEWGREKKKRPTPRARKSKQREKIRGKLK